MVGPPTPSVGLRGLLLPLLGVLADPPYGTLLCCGTPGLNSVLWEDHVAGKPSSHGWSRAVRDTTAVRQVCETLSGRQGPVGEWPPTCVHQQSFARRYQGGRPSAPDMGSRPRDVAPVRTLPHGRRPRADGVDGSEGGME